MNIPKANKYEKPPHLKVGDRVRTDVNRKITEHVLTELYPSPAMSSGWAIEANPSFMRGTPIDASWVEVITDAPNALTPYPTLGKEIGELVEKKQVAYGNSHGKSGDVMRILYPQGIAPTQMDDALTVVRVLDKLFRIATDRDALGEDPWKDLCGYGLLAAAKGKK